MKILGSGVTEGSRYGENNRPTPIQMDRQKLKNMQNKLAQETMKTRQISWSNLCSFGFFLWGIIPKQYFVFASLGANNPVSLLCFLSWIGLNVLFFLGCSLPLFSSLFKTVKCSYFFLHLLSWIHGEDICQKLLVLQRKEVDTKYLNLSFGEASSFIKFDISI